MILFCYHILYFWVPRTLLHFEASFQLFHDRDPYGIETSPLICRANQWNGFYMIGISIMKELRIVVYISQLLYVLFISNTRLKLAKNQAKAKQPEAELLLFENYSLSSFMLSKNDKRYLKKYSKKYAKTSISVLIRL